MRRYCFGIVTIFILWTFQACSSNAGNSTVSSADSISSADSLNALKDTAPDKNYVPEKADVDFTLQVASGAATEIAIGKLAQQKGQNKRVKNFGTMMIKDLAKANAKIETLAKKKNIKLPAAPAAGDQKTIDELSKKSGSDFDKAYISEMITDHQKYIHVFEEVSKNTSDPDIKSFANKTLPALKNHLDAINTIHDSMK